MLLLMYSLFVCFVCCLLLLFVVVDFRIGISHCAGEMPDDLALAQQSEDELQNPDKRERLLFRKLGL